MKIYKEFPPDLMITLLWVILTLVFVITPDLEDTPVRTALGILMVLFIPGYVLIAALYPGKDDLEFVERIALSLGLSIVVVPLLGLLLNFTLGIKLLPILLTLCIFAIALIFAAAYRRGKLPEEERFSVPFYKVYEIISNEISSPKSRTDMILTYILIFSIAVAAGMILFVVTTPKIGERFTEFYILDASGKADKYPTNLKYNYPAELLVGVVNQEYVTINYTVRIALDKEVLTDTRLKLNHNETWEKNITFIPDKEGNDMKLEFWLFREDNFTAPYRMLHLWVNVTK